MIFSFLGGVFVYLFDGFVLGVVVVLFWCFLMLTDCWLLLLVCILVFCLPGLVVVLGGYCLC